MQFLLDLRYGLRVIAKAPGFTLAALACIAFGIGLNTAMFTMLKATLLQKVPGVDKPSGLVMLEGRNSYQEYETYRDQNTALSGLMAYMPLVPFNVGDGGKAERVWGHVATGSYFSVLGVKPHLGRLFLPEDDRPGASHVVVLSHYLWQTQYNADPALVGRVIQVNRRGCTVIGIAAPLFAGPAPLLSPADLWLPASSRTELISTLEGGGATMLSWTGIQRSEDASLVFSIEGRLRPGVPLVAAQASLDTIAARFERNQPRAGEEKRRSVMRLLPADRVVPVRPEDKVLVTVMPIGLTVLVLLIACANVANMLLARAAVRQKEIAIRLALGAARGRLIRQLLTENVMLSACGGLMGLLLAFWATHLLASVKIPLPFKLRLDMSPDLRVLGFAVALSFITGIVFGLAPSLQATRVDLVPSLKERAPSTGGGKRLFGLRNLLVMWQISGSLVLLLITGFLALGYRHVNQIDVGFQPRGVYMLSVDPVRDGYAPADVGLLFERLIERAKRIPGVAYASLTDTVPLNLIGAGQPILFTVDRDTTPRRAIRSTVTEGYFETLQIPIVRGRSFNLHDREASPLPVILNEKAARTLWPDRDALGQVLRSGDRLYQIIGVSQDGKFGMLMEGSPTYIYQPMPRRALGRSTVSGTTLLVRAAGAAEAIEAALRRAVEQEDPRLTVFNAGSMWDHVNIIFFRIKLGTWIYGGLGLVGLLIAAVGLYGLTSYSVAQRRHEIGLRMALGARRWDILKLVLREALIVLAIGMAIGELMGFAVGRVLASAIQQISAVIGKGTSDLTLLVGVPLLLAVVDLAACYLPARRAALIDPLAALRHE